jgi:hypothetical protein
MLLIEEGKNALDVVTWLYIQGAFQVMPLIRSWRQYTWNA